MGHEYRNTGGRDRSRAVLVRDAALARVSRARRWVIVGVAALTAGFAALVSAVAPGRSLASKRSAGAVSTSASAASSSSRGSSAIPSLPAPASSSDLGLQAPGQAPSSGDSQPQDVQPQPQPQPAPQPAPQVSPAPSSGGGVVSGGS